MGVPEVLGTAFLHSSMKRARSADRNVETVALSPFLFSFPAVLDKYSHDFALQLSNVAFLFHLLRYCHVIRTLD